MFHSHHRPISHRFRDIGHFRRISPIFPTPGVYTSPDERVPLEFGIGAMSTECFYDGTTRWSKKFSDRFSRFDTIPAVTDTQPPSQPSSHVAVANRHNAYASHLTKPANPGSPGKMVIKTERERERVPCCLSPVLHAAIQSHCIAVGHWTPSL